MKKALSRFFNVPNNDTTVQNKTESQKTEENTNQKKHESSESNIENKKMKELFNNFPKLEGIFMEQNTSEQCINFSYETHLKLPPINDNDYFSFPHHYLQLFYTNDTFILFSLNYSPKKEILRTKLQDDIVKHLKTLYDMDKEVSKSHLFIEGCTRKEAEERVLKERLLILRPASEQAFKNTQSSQCSNCFCATVYNLEKNRAQHLFIMIHPDPVGAAHLFLITEKGNTIKFKTIDELKNFKAFAENEKKDSPLKSTLQKILALDGLENFDIKANFLDNCIEFSYRTALKQTISSAEVRHTLQLYEKNNSYELYSLNYSPPKKVLTATDLIEITKHLKELHNLEIEVSTHHLFNQMTRERAINTVFNKPQLILRPVTPTAFKATEQEQCSNCFAAAYYREDQQRLTHITVMIAPGKNFSIKTPSQYLNFISISAFCEYIVQGMFPALKPITSNAEFESFEDFENKTF